jgi:polysaccharide pyruvyl transferase WcaK-like protein
MRLFILNAHWHNRGDEAALRALLRKVDEQYNCDIYLQLITNEKPTFNDLKNSKVKLVSLFPRKSTY